MALTQRSIRPRWSSGGAEVEQRWGKPAPAASSQWWEAKSAPDKSEWMFAVRELNQAWISCAADGAAPDGEAAQSLA